MFNGYNGFNDCFFKANDDVVGVNTWHEEIRFEYKDYKVIISNPTHYEHFKRIMSNRPPETQTETTT